MMEKTELSQLDRDIVNHLQDGFPLCERPYQQVAEQLGTSEEVLLQRLETLLEDKSLTRFGPMYHAERLGGGLTLAAMKIPEQDFDRVTEQVNSFPEVAHNYQRAHELNMWFVLATETEEQVLSTIARIEDLTGFHVYNMPKQEEFYVGLRFHF